jgi:hypothetical protein
MSNDLRSMEWLYHVDLDPMKHGSRADIQRTAGIAWDNIQHHQKPQEGDLLVIAIVRPNSSQKH